MRLRYESRIEECIDALFIGCFGPVYFLEFQQRLDLRCECEVPVLPVVNHRLHTEAVAEYIKHFILCVIDRYGKHPIEQVHKIYTPLHKCLQYDLGIRCGSAFEVQLMRYILEIVNLT